MLLTDTAMPPLPEFRPLDVEFEVPVRSEMLPDGRSALVSGDTEDSAQLLASDADEDVLRDAPPSLVACTQIIREFTPGFSAIDLREYLTGIDPDMMGENSEGASLALEQLAQTLADFDVPSHVEQARSLEDLAHHLESGSGVLAAVNLGQMWNSSSEYGNGDANGVVVALGVARDPHTGDILGWYLNDVVAKQVRSLYDAARMQGAWLDTGGWLIVTDIVRRRWK
jgi:hypothetical protein